MRNQTKREAIPTAIKDTSLERMEKWGKGDVTGIIAAVNKQRRLLDRVEEMIKQDLWNMAAGKGGN